MSATDPELLLHALTGDAEAFAELYRRRQAGIYRYALHMTGRVSAAEDVTQESFLTLLAQGSKYDALRGTIAAFLFGIARNLIMRRLERDLWTEPVEEMDLADRADILDDLTRRESIELVRRAVLSLPPVYREVVVLCDLEDVNYEEAAVTLDCPVGTVRSRLSRARKVLARKLGGVRNREADAARCL